jgi:hypothetical protein
MFKLKKIRIKLYNTLAVPVLLYRSENWATKARDASRITAAEMKYTRRTAGYTRAGRKTNTEIARELNTTPILDRIYDHKKKWIQHVNRMPRGRLSRLQKNLHPKKKKEPRKTAETLLDV